MKKKVFLLFQNMAAPIRCAHTGLLIHKVTPPETTHWKDVGYRRTASRPQTTQIVSLVPFSEVEDQG